MDNNIQKILQELYTLSPELKQDEQRLIEIVSKLSAARPNVPLDEAFVYRLKQKLIQKQAPAAQNSWSFLSIINVTTMKKLNYSIGIATLVAVLILGAIYLPGNPTQNKKVSFDPGLKITATGEHAFGELASVSEVNNAGGRGGGADNSAAAPNAPTKENSTASSPGFGGMGGDVRIGMVPPFDYPVYRYVYAGEELNLGETKREVLKRVKGEHSVEDLGGLLGYLNFGLVDIGTFQNLRLQSANFVQPGENGYNIYVNVDESTININGAWPMHAMEKSSAMSVMPEPPRIRLEDIPADSELIAIANQFLGEHNIPTQAYGLPEVLNDFKIQYANAADKSSFWLPDTINVVYPLKIDEQSVFDEGGYKTGLNVGVNIRNKKVVSVYDLSVQNYQSSMYDAETDVSRILKVAEKGGVYGWMPEGTTKFTDVEIGTPTIEFVKMWNYNGMKSEELLIPSLVFPVLKQPTGEFYFRKSVVVPLVKEILDRNQDPVRIMPMETPMGAADAVPAPATKREE